MEINLPDMHRSGAEAQWHSIPKEQWNKYQIFADKHGEWATPGNLVTAMGAVATASGLALLNNDNPSIKLAGVAGIGVGRYMDILDGKIAAKTGTMSPLGERVDATTDTVLMVGALATLLSNGILPVREGLALAGLTVIKSTASVVAEHRKNEIHVSRAGKLGVFAAWSGIGLHAIGSLANSYNAEGLGHESHLAGTFLNIAGIALQAVAATDYIRSAIGRSNPQA